jgi:CBS domain-containing protein
MRDVSIHRIMTPAPATLEPTATVLVAERLMRERGCHHVPVVHRGRVVGMLARQDLLKALVPRADSDGAASSRGDLAARHVRDVMQPDVQVLSQTSTLLDAARVLASGDFHALPVVAADRRLLGIVTSTDVIRALVDDLAPAGGSESAGVAAAEDGTDPVTRALREVYRAARNYLHSGRAEAEHSRLLRSVEHARDVLHAANLDL